MARPQTASEADILAAAGRVLDAGGPDAFTLAAVAREVGLTRAGVAFRFESARRLKLAVLDARARMFSELMAGLQLERGGNGLLKLARFIGAMARNPRNLISYLSTGHAGQVDEDLFALEQQRGISLRQAIARAMPEGLPDHEGATEMFAAHLTGTLIAWAASGEPDGRAFLDRRTRVWLTMTGIGFNTADVTALRLASA